MTEQTVKDMKTVARASSAFLALCAVFAVALPFYKFGLTHPIDPESWLEILQEALLGAATLVFFWCARREPENRAALTLVGGFLGCLLVRELDAYFDLLSHGCWKYFVAVWIAAVFWGVFRAGAGTALPGLARYIRSTSFPLMAAAVAGLLVYSRLIGSTRLFWTFFAEQAGAQFSHLVKAFVEESHEALFYTLILTAALVYLNRPNRKPG